MERILVFRNVFLNEVSDPEKYYERHSKDCNYFNFITDKDSISELDRLISVCKAHNFPYMMVINTKNTIDIASKRTQIGVFNIRNVELLNYALKKVSFIATPIRLSYAKNFKPHIHASIENLRCNARRPQYCIVKNYKINPFHKLPLIKSGVLRGFLNLTTRLVGEEFDFMKTYQNICICGNGPDNYEKNISNKIIDDADCVVRMNTYHIIPEISGEKTTIHCMFSTDQKFHDDSKPIYINRNKSDYIFTTNDPAVNKRLGDICTLEKPSYQINFNLLDRYMRNISTRKRKRPTGLYCMLFFACIKMKYNIDSLRIYGIGNHKIINNSQQYYFGERQIDDRCIEQHTNHNWELQKYIYDFLKTIKIINH